MKATDLLEQQHDEVKDLFEKISSASRDAMKRKLFEQLAANLVAHDGIERELFYPACEDTMGMTDLLGEALVEHGLVEFSLYQADQALGEDDFDFKLTVLKEVVEHHVKEEEGEFFPSVNRAIGKDALELLGDEMEQKFAELKLRDFRRPLHSNLKQVLQGAIKPAPKQPRSPAGRTATRPSAKLKSTAPRSRKASKKASKAARRR